MAREPRLPRGMDRFRTSCSIGGSREPRQGNSARSHAGKPFEKGDIRPGDKVSNVD